MASPELVLSPVVGTPARHRFEVRELAAAALALAGQETLEATVAEIGRRARAIVPGCDDVAVTLVRSRGRIETPGADGLAAACVPLLFEPEIGPGRRALDAAEPIRIRDTKDEQRWPDVAARLASLGVGSLLATPMKAARGTVGILTCVATSVGALDGQDILLTTAYATHAGIALAHAELENNLRVGLQTREEIGRAVGILMERHRITATAAFDMLVVASQHSHRKLRDVAAWMNETGEDPAALIRTRA